MNRKTITNEAIAQIILIAIFVVGLVIFVLPILQAGLVHMGDVVCGSSVQLRSTFANLFLGWFGRAIIPDRFFDLIPLMCRIHVQTVTEADEEVEKLMADEIVDCFNKFGGGRLDGVFPHASILCSTIIYNVPVDYTTDEYEIDLMEVYEEILNHEDFDSVFDEDADEGLLDYKNYFRFCLRPEYQVNIFRHMDTWFTSDVNICRGSTATAVVSSGAAASPSGGDSEEGHEFSGDECTDEFQASVIIDWLSEEAISSVRNSCFSIMEAAVNNWQFDMRDSSSILDIISKMDMIQLCSELCYRDCEYSSEDYVAFQECEDACDNNCDSFSCNRLLADNPNCGGKFVDDIKHLFYPHSGVNPSGGFSKGAVLRRGTIYIRFFDYTDWIQQLTDLKWHYFPECENDIILLGPLKGGIREAVDLDASRKHDYIAVCYTPYIPYEINNVEEFGSPEEGLVIVT
jgi:hypothetical protein